MIQSTKPASISGMRLLIPSPAGVIAPVRLIADRDLRLQHPLGEQVAAFPQPAGVVGKERVVDQVGDGFVAGDRRSDRSGGRAGTGRWVVSSLIPHDW